MKLDCSGFPAATHAALNALTDLSVDLQDLTRAAMTVGYPSRKMAIAQVGAWRARALRHLVHGYVTPGLAPTNYFRNLETTEKAAMSFLLAEAFTLLFAQKAMGLWYLVHVRGCGFDLKVGTPKLKPHAIAKSSDVRPDFIGRKIGEHHVFETKGRQRKLSTLERNRALGQVSAISNINGTPPKTRVVAAFTFAKAGIRGQIVDPEATADHNLIYDEAMAVRKYYTAFRNSRALSRMRQIGDFICLEVGDGLVWGVDRKIPTLLQPGTDDELNGDLPVLNHLEHRQEVYADLNGQGLSVGPDGVVFGLADHLQARQTKG